MGKSGKDLAFYCSDRFPFIVLCSMNASGLLLYNAVFFLNFILGPWIFFMFLRRQAF